MYGCAGVQISNNVVSVQNAYELDTACTSDCTCTGVPKRSLARNSTAYTCHSPVDTSVVVYFTMQVLHACLLLSADGSFTAPPVSRALQQKLEQASSLPTLLYQCAYMPGAVGCGGRGLGPASDCLLG